MLDFVCFKDFSLNVEGTDMQFSLAFVWLIRNRGNIEEMRYHVAV